MTIVFISPGMKVSGANEKDQWISWEVSFSLRTTKRKKQNDSTCTSNPNAMLAVVLPDANGSYDYFLEKKNCCTECCTTHHTNNTFAIIRQNMFNRNSGDKRVCNTGSTIWRGEFSYIHSVKWCDFIKNTEAFIDGSYKRQKNISNYEIHINIS